MIDDVFGPGGLFAEKFEGYEPRPGQVAMAEAVDRALVERSHLIVEGPCGVGKSVAYLVPAIRRVSERNKRLPLGSESARVLVVTGNIALQEQLVGKDLPMLRDLLPEKFTFALAKGRNNYLCQDAFGKFLGENLLARKGDQVDRLIEWAKVTKTGDVSEFPEQPDPRTWKRMSVGSDECKGSGCSRFADCFAEEAKRAVAAADVVVTNYHLFFAHLVVREKMKQIRANGGSVDVDVVLPPAGVVIFDEAHKAADVARDFLGFQVTSGAIDWLVRGLNHELGAIAKREAEAFFACMLRLKKSRAYKSRLKKGHGLDGRGLSVALAAVAKLYRDSVAAAAWSPDERAELESRGKRGALLAAQVEMACRPEAYPDKVFFIEEVERGAGVILKMKPIEVADFLKQELFGSFGTVVLTSATLATGAGSSPFAFVRREVGMEGGAELVVDSPFDWAKNAMLVIPETMPDPKREPERYSDEVARHVREAAREAGGRTLGLFTSYKNLNLAYEECRDLPYKVLRHGDAPRTLLATRFKQDVTSVLLGTESFWAGIDVPGEALSCVVIDRLPFVTPDDPVVDAIAEKDDRWFFNYAVPRAIIQLKQGVGRLIRTSTDRGVIVVLDKRLRTMGYGREFVRALPQMRMGDEVADVGRFLGEVKP